MIQIHQNLDEVSTKLAELKNLFKFGGKLVPIIESIIEFLNDTVPLIDNVNLSIKESTNKMPQATDQINDVTFATELATTEILDLVDKINDDLNQVEQHFFATKEKIKYRVQALEQLKKIIENEEAKKIIDELIKDEPYFQSFELILNLLKVIEENANKITLSLQVQDITSQQLHAVNNLIMNIHKQLSNMLVVLNNDDTPIVSGSDLDSGHEFDANASYTDPKNKQSDVNKIVNQQLKNTSQEEIDKLFS